jgi:hypothetical protein
MATSTIDTLACQMPEPPPNVHQGQSAASFGVHQLSGLILPQQWMPDPLWFAPTIDARLKIEQPFRVRIAHDGDIATAFAEEIDEFGYGPNVGYALSDLGKTIAELYLSLEGVPNLSGDLARVRAILETHIRRVHP